VLAATQISHLSSKHTHPLVTTSPAGWRRVTPVYVGHAVLLQIPFLDNACTLCPPSFLALVPCPPGPPPPRLFPRALPPTTNAPSPPPPPLPPPPPHTHLSCHQVYEFRHVAPAARVCCEAHGSEAQCCCCRPVGRIIRQQDDGLGRQAVSIPACVCVCVCACVCVLAYMHCVCVCVCVCGGGVLHDRPCGSVLCCCCVGAAMVHSG